MSQSAQCSAGLCRPNSWGGRVIDGDASDLVNVMAGPVIVGLQAKGKAKTDEGAFVVDTRIIGRAAA